MGQRFDRRGKRTDEMLELMKALWQPGWTEFDGEFYPTPRLEMEPTPPHIPIYRWPSDIALRRAARYDGWIGDLITTERAIDASSGCVNCVPKKACRWTISPSRPRSPTRSPPRLRACEAAGITGIVTMPWMFYCGPEAGLAEANRRHCRSSAGISRWTLSVVSGYFGDGPRSRRGSIQAEQPAEVPRQVGDDGAAGSRVRVGGARRAISALAIPRPASARFGHGAPATGSHCSSAKAKKPSSHQGHTSPGGRNRMPAVERRR